MRAVRKDHETTTQTSSDYLPTLEIEGLQQQRFVAGEAFFNYDDFGGLRPGQEAIKLFSWNYFGLAVHFTLCGFAFQFICFGYGRLLGEYLKANDDQQVYAANYALVWPQTLAIFIGIVSDAFPLFGYRRKSYMVIGWVISIVMYAIIIIMDQFSHSSEKLFASAAKDKFDSSNDQTGNASLYPIAYLFVSLIAGIGIQISWISAIAVAVEYAQREYIYDRGRLIATLIAVYYLGGVVGKLVAACLISEGVNDDHWVSTVSMGEAVMLLTGVSVFAIPFVLFGFQEEVVNKYHPSKVLAFSDRMSYFWKFCHSNVVNRILFFLGLSLFFLGLYNQNVRDAVAEWSHVSRKELLFVDASRLGIQVISTFTWMYYLRNVSWRRIAFAAMTIYVSLYVIFTMFTTHDVIRSKWFYSIMISLIDWPSAWLVLYAIILGTEIADVGHEGMAVTMGISFQALGGVAGYTLGEIFPTIFGNKVTMDEVREDSPETRMAVTKAFFTIVAFNLVGFLLVRVPPLQKLDAQQMRSFGGYNKSAGVALLVVFVIMLTFDLAVNVVVVL